MKDDNSTIIELSIEDVILLTKLKKKNPLPIQLNFIK